MRVARIYSIWTHLRIHYLEGSVERFNASQMYQTSMSFGFLCLFYRASPRRVSLNTSAREAFELTIKILNPYVPSGRLLRY